MFIAEEHPTISEEAIKATTKCTKGMSCLTKGRKDLCKVDHRVGDKVYFIKCLCKDACSYKYPFGLGHYCTCPIRGELFDKYRI